jgi:D-alanyl-D-alanine carboxypeptidase
MAERENRNTIEIEEDKRGGVWRLYSSEVMAALIIVVLVIAVAFFVNKFFYGFDLPELSFSEPVVSDQYSGPGKKEKSFVQSEDWRLVLVNRDHPLEEEYSGELTELRYGQSVDSRIYPDLQAMFDEMRADGLSPKVAEGYRSREDQAQKLSDKIEDYISYGKSREEATELALTRVEEPGTCEHETGMCVDISSEEEDNESSSEVWKWMDENGSRYGFIKRYPYDKSDITGIKGEPWHYRYVGTEAAEEIMEKGITLEEYLGAASRSGSAE